MEFVIETEYKTLIDNALHDADPDIREHAVMLLARECERSASLFQVFAQIAVQDADSMVRRAAIASLVEYWRDDLWVFTLLLERLRCEPRDNDHDIVRLFVIKILGGYYADHPKTLSVLDRIAKADSNPIVRRRAVSEIAAHWPNADVYLRRYRKSPDPEIRAAAVTALARHFSDSAGTYTIVKTHAQSDRSPDVRSSALEALTDYYRGNANAFEVIKDRALNDSAVSVCLCAITELARGWKHHVETRQILEQIAGSDKTSQITLLIRCELRRFR